MLGRGWRAVTMTIYCKQPVSDHIRSVTGTYLGTTEVPTQVPPTYLPRYLHIYIPITYQFQSNQEYGLIEAMEAGNTFFCAEESVPVTTSPPKGTRPNVNLSKNDFGWDSLLLLRQSTRTNIVSPVSLFLVANLKSAFGECPAMTVILGSEEELARLLRQCYQRERALHHAQRARRPVTLSKNSRLDQISRSNTSP